jgi:PTH1 family peptidyl-tRNA hydrolase
MDSQVSTPPGVYLLVGLGNPGRQYASTRHNIGFMILDRLADRLETGFSRVQLRSLVTDTRYHGRRLLLVKPQTYMNESGVSVGALVKFHKILLSNLMVVHDDVDLPFGTLRLRPGGGSAGQKGVESIQTRLSTQEFPRLRFGVGRPPGNMLAAVYVLQNFSRDEMEFLPSMLDRAADAILTFVTDGLERAMTRFNGEVGAMDD